MKTEGHERAIKRCSGRASALPKDSRHSRSQYCYASVRLRHKNGQPLIILVGHNKSVPDKSVLHLLAARRQISIRLPLSLEIQPIHLDRLGSLV